MGLLNKYKVCGQLHRITIDKIINKYVSETHVGFRVAKYFIKEKNTVVEGQGAYKYYITAIYMNGSVRTCTEVDFNNIEEAYAWEKILNKECGFDEMSVEQASKERTVNPKLLKNSRWFLCKVSILAPEQIEKRLIDGFEPFAIHSGEIYFKAKGRHT